MFVVWNNVKEAVDRLNRLDLNMKIHSEVRRGQFGPRETLVMQEEAEDTMGVRSSMRLPISARTTTVTARSSGSGFPRKTMPRWRLG